MIISSLLCIVICYNKLGTYTHVRSPPGCRREAGVAAQHDRVYPLADRHCGKLPRYEVEPPRRKG